MYYVFVRLLEPLPLLLLLLGFGLLLLQRRSPTPNRPLRFTWLVYLLLVVVSLPAFSYLALGTLEWNYAPDMEIPKDRQAIVVLSGALKDVQNDTETMLADDTLYRCLKAIRLYNMGDPCPVITTGGKVHAGDPGPMLAEAMRDFLVSQGVPLDRIIVESNSRSTYENAVEVGKIIQERALETPILLVTDVTHLARSERCFEKQGIDVIPIGCRFSNPEFDWSYDQFIPSPGALSSVHDVIHEWLGMAWYRIKNRI